MSEIQELFSLLATYGVPIVLSVYLVYWITNKLNGKLEKLSTTMEDLSRNIQRLIDIIERR